ncbi:RagB/SusD family nutrient uptake outer membrane protein [Bacteroides fragilis]|nr:RagB/SusD family nutrient uptake outer membrane protein [Bacteroides fragilis]
MPTTMPSKEEALAFVRNERRIELASNAIALMIYGVMVMITVGTL